MGVLYLSHNPKRVFMKVEAIVQKAAKTPV
jgi:hypothetical protein